MAYKVLFTVAGLDTGDEDLKLLSDLCAQIDARLSVLVLLFAAPVPLGTAYALSTVWIEEREADIRRLDARTQSISALLAEFGGAADVTSDYVEVSQSDETIGRRGRYADLTVIGPKVFNDSVLRQKAIEGALFSSGKPLLILPAFQTATLTPRRVLVAWDSRIEATRAVGSSMELLTAANDVHLVLVDPLPGEYQHGEEPGADAATYLAHHGVNVTVDRLPRMEHSVADILRRHASDISAEMIVMGAYGHSRFRERLFGSVTRSMLSECTLPLLLTR